MDDVNILAEIVRPTGDATTNCRTYKYFFAPNRFRTENYANSRFDVIGILGEKIKEVTAEPLTSLPLYQKNIDFIASEFAKSKKIYASLEILYSLIEMNFRNLKKLEADYFIDPEIDGHEQVIFKVLIKDKPRNILKEEERFYSQMSNIIPLGEQKYFSLIYQVI